MGDLVTLSSLEDGIALLRFDDQQGKNTFSEPFIEQLLACLARLAEDRSTRVCVVRGSDEVIHRVNGKEVLRYQRP